MQRLIEREADFSRDRYPKITVIPERTSHDVRILVEGEKYPKFLVRFRDIAALKWADESFDSGDTLFPNIEVDKPRQGCFAEVLGSEWPNSLGKEMVEYQYGTSDLHHFVVFGCDIIVEVLSPHEPDTERVEGPQEICSICA